MIDNHAARLPLRNTYIRPLSKAENDRAELRRMIAATCDPPREWIELLTRSDDNA